MRRAFHIASAISLVLFVAAASLWGRSHEGGDVISFVAGSRRFVLRTVYGQVSFESLSYTRRLYSNGPHWASGDADAAALYRFVPLPDSGAPAWGFWSARVSVGMGGQIVATGYVAAAPLWSATLVTAILPLLWLIDARRRRGRRGRAPSQGFVSDVATTCAPAETAAPSAGRRLARQPPDVLSRLRSAEATRRRGWWSRAFFLCGPCHEAGSTLTVPSASIECTTRLTA
jgi:hypothetical protein